MRVKGKVLAVKDNLIKVECDRRVPPAGTYIDIRWGSQRTLDQNSLYWLYLTWILEEGRLREEHGYQTPDVLHDNLKAHFLSDKIMTKDGFKAIETRSSTELTKVEFGEYFEKCDEFFNNFFGIDTTPFWVEYKDYSKY